MSDGLPPPTSAQIRAARAWLQMTQDEFVELTGIPKRTLARLELGENAPYGDTLGRVRDALTKLGVELVFENGRDIGIVVREGERTGTKPNRVKVRARERSEAKVQADRE